MTNIILKGKQIIVRLPSKADAPELAQQINSKDIARWTSHIPYPYKLKDAVDFIAKQKKRLQDKTDYSFLIIDKTSEEIIGGIGIHNHYKQSKKAELGYWLVKEKWGQGLTTEAVSLVLKFGFKKLKLHRIYAYCFEVNIGSKKVLEKNGFKLEGVQRESEFKFGKWHNLLQYSILNKEYKK